MEMYLLQVTNVENFTITRYYITDPLRVLHLISKSTASNEQCIRIDNVYAAMLTMCACWKVSLYSVSLKRMNLVGTIQITA